jgi:hypothetical protein
MEVNFSETSVLTGDILRHIKEDSIFIVAAVKSQILHSINWLGSVAEA